MICPACHTRFSGERSFDRHRAGNCEQRDRRGRIIQWNTRHCLSDQEMLDAGFHQNAYGMWVFGSRLPQHLRNEARES